MCGIIGYIGNTENKKKQALPIVLKNLENLEYRGYDSSGAAFWSESGIQRIRSAGPLPELKKKIKNHSSSSAIGHVRWATHGAPTEKNAHPQKQGLIYIVHNGAIENASKIKESLSCRFSSSTDTEVIAALIHHFYSKKKDILKAVSQASQKLKGLYAYALLCEDLKNHIIGSRNGPPLLIAKGKDKGEFFISSDLPSLLKHSNSIYVLGNKEIFYIKEGKLQFFSFKGDEIRKQPKKIKGQESKKEKGKFPHFMLKEIFDQPESLRRLLNHYLKKGEVCFDSRIKQAVTKQKKLFITACGSSFYAALYGKWMIEKKARIPVEALLASEFQYQDPLIKKNSPVLFISQSGETADTLSSLELAKKKGAFCFSFCNAAHSSLERRSDVNLPLHTGPEYAVASTKTFTSSLMMLNLLALYLSGQKGSKLFFIPDQVEIILSQLKTLEKIAHEVKNFKNFLYLARGHLSALSLEGALKMKELAYRHAEGYPSGEMKHGPLALVGKDTLIIGLAPQDEYYEKNMINFEEALSRGGRMLSISSGGGGKLKKRSSYYLDIPSADPLAAPIFSAVYLQALSYFLSKALGHDPDHPRNLAKSVTVE